MASTVDSSASVATSWESGTATLRPCQRINTSMSWAQESSGARLRTSTVSPLWSGETTLDDDAPSRERKLDFVLQVVVPAECLFLGPVGIDDDFIVDSFFADTILAQFGHVVLDSSLLNFVHRLDGGFQPLFHLWRIAASDIRIGVLAQDSLNALAKLVQVFLQGLILGVVGFGCHIANKFVEFVESEAKYRTLSRLRHDS